MKLFKRASLSILALATIGITTPNYAHAEGFALQDWSARAASLAGGVVARGGDASAVAYNPAAITELEGTQVMGGAEIISLTNSIKGPYTITSEDRIYAAPHGYITHKFNDNVSLGLGLYSRYGLGNKYDQNWFGAAQVYNIQLLTTSLTPVLAYKVNDNLSLGMGLEIMGGIVELDKNIKMGPVTVVNKLSGDALDFGYNLSMHYRFNEQWKAGLTYRSHVTLDFDGTNDRLMMIGAVPQISSIDGSAKLYTPASFTFALAYFPTEKLSFEGQVQYNTWSRYTELAVELKDGTRTSEIKDWEDTWFFSLSTEYEYNDWLTLRAGISHETSPVKQAWADYVAPVNGRWKYTAGFGIHKDNWTYDMSYIYHDIKNLDYSGSHTSGVVQASHSSEVNAHTVAFTLGYKF